MLAQGKKVIIIGIVTALLFLVGAGTSFYIKNRPYTISGPANPFPEKNDTTPQWFAGIDMNVNNWKTYRNEEKKFGFKYPPQFKDAIFSDSTGTFGTEGELYSVHILLGEQYYEGISFMNNDAIRATGTIEGNIEEITKRKREDIAIREVEMLNGRAIVGMDSKTKAGPYVFADLVDPDRFISAGSLTLPTLTLEQTETVLVSILKTFEFID